MGIYSDGNIYGIRWSVYDSSDEEIIRFERISNNNSILSEEDIIEIKAEYEIFQNNIFQNKNIYHSCIISYKIYTSCCSTYEFGRNDIMCMSWFPVNKESLDKIFLKGNEPIPV